jgi:four helix bundle protein
MENIARCAKADPGDLARLPRDFRMLGTAGNLHCVSAMPRDHRKLDAFNLADRLALTVYRLTSKFPPSERYGLQSQMRRASISTPTNIVEGCAREGEGDYLRFLDIAFASSRELVYLTTLARRLSYLDEPQAKELHDLGERVAGALARLRRSYGRR